ncbi:GNAT family N-acetyltransferase, partial [Streptomyces sp. S6]
MTRRTTVVAHALTALLAAFEAAVEAALHTWRSRGQAPAPPGSDTGPRPPAGDTDGLTVDGTGTLWRMRTTVKDAPGSLAALCAALAGHRVDILSLQTHPLGEDTVDEFLLRAPGALGGAEISRAVQRAGGSATWIERADAHDLVD